MKDYFYSWSCLYIFSQRTMCSLSKWWHFKIFYTQMGWYLRASTWRYQCHILLSVTRSALLIANPAHSLQDPHEHRCALLEKVLLLLLPSIQYAIKWKPNFLLESSILHSQETESSIGQIISLCLENSLGIWDTPPRNILEIRRFRIYRLFIYH